MQNKVDVLRAQGEMTPEFARSDLAMGFVALLARVEAKAMNFSRILENAACSQAKPTASEKALEGWMQEELKGALKLKEKVQAVDVAAKKEVFLQHWGKLISVRCATGEHWYTTLRANPDLEAVKGRIQTFYGSLDVKAVRQALHDIQSSAKDFEEALRSTGEDTMPATIDGLDAIRIRVGSILAAVQYINIMGKNLSGSEARAAVSAEVRLIRALSLREKDIMPASLWKWGQSVLGAAKPKVGAA